MLSPNQQFSYTVEIFYFDDNNAPNGERTGWVAIYSDRPEITGYITIGRKDLTSLNGLALDSNTIVSLTGSCRQSIATGMLPVEFSTLNDTFYTVYYDMSRVGKDGLIIDSRTDQAAGANNRVVQPMPDIFPRDHLDTEGYIWMTAAQGVFSNEIYNNGISTEIIKGIDREKFIGVKKVYAPQFATVDGWKTTLNLINANENDADGKVHVPCAETGNALAVSERPWSKASNSGANIKDLLPNPPSGLTTIVGNPDFPNTVGWLEVESTQERILGLVTFNADDDRFSASFELSGTAADQFSSRLSARTSITRPGCPPEHE